MNDARDHDKGMEAFVAALVKSARTSEKSMRGTLGLLAGLLRHDQLPAPGRAFLADVLEGIAKGGDPADLIPRGKKKKSATSIEIFVDVEEAKDRLGASHGDMNDVYAFVSRKRGLEATTVRKEASLGRTILRETMTENITAGVAPSLVVAAEAKLLGLPADVLEKLLIAPGFER